MARRLPPLNALKAFEAAARNESFTRAAEELCVTQGAVSHQVKALEAELGLKLFIREPQRLVITEAGRDYLVVVRDALDRIAVGTERLLQRQSAGVLTVSTSPNFASKWLVHRLGRFADVHPSIDLRVSATLHNVDFAREDIDVAVRGLPSSLLTTRHGDRISPGLEVTHYSAQRSFSRYAAPSSCAAGMPCADLRTWPIIRSCISTIVRIGPSGSMPPVSTTPTCRAALSSTRRAWLLMPR